VNKQGLEGHLWGPHFSIHKEVGRHFLSTFDNHDSSGMEQISGVIWTERNTLEGFSQKKSGNKGVPICLASNPTNDHGGGHASQPWGKVNSHWGGKQNDGSHNSWGKIGFSKQGGDTQGA